jgi:hypothetical protein
MLQGKGYMTFRTVSLTTDLGKIDITSMSAFILQVGEVYKLGWAFCTIIAFYFGTHLIQFFSKKA